MREILFRGKRLDNSEWIYGSYIKQKNNHYISDGTLTGCRSLGNVFEVDPETIGQYAGIDDKNGVQIFEGDICQVDKPCVSRTGIIEFKDGSFYYKDKRSSSELYLSNLKFNNFTIEVIGNIHDNFFW